jgi:endonuclease YncB( thermonuclease family)
MEKKQPYGQRAKDFITDLVAGKEITLMPSYFLNQDLQQRVVEYSGL